MNPSAVCFGRRFELVENRSREGVAPNYGVLDKRFSTGSKLLELNGGDW
jgi:copper homeostasis protein CutC